MEVTDAAIIAGSVSDARRFVAIFDRHYGAIARYLRRRLSGPAAHDVAAEVFTVAFARRASYDSRYADALPWLFGIATNLLRAHIRAEARQLTLIARSIDGAAAAEDTADVVVERALRQGVADALLRLSIEERETLLLYAWADLDYSEIALALGIPIGTVKSRLNRARSRVRAALTDQPFTREEAANG